MLDKARLSEPVQPDVTFERVLYVNFEGKSEMLRHRNCSRLCPLLLLSPIPYTVHPESPYIPQDAVPTPQTID